MPSAYHPAALLPRLGARVRLVPVTSEDSREWVDYDLASMVEGSYGVLADPCAIDRREWVPRLGEAWSASWAERSGRFWITRDGRRVGTLGVLPGLGRDWLPLGSLYVDPSARGEGLAGTALALAQDAAVLSGHRGIALDTSWAWFRPARLYLRLGFWVLHWKHDLCLVRGPEIPPTRLDVTGDSAAFFVGAERIFSAGRDGPRLDWHPVGEVGDRRELARHDGFVVNAPCLPGVRYRTWEEISEPPARAVLVTRLRSVFSRWEVRTLSMEGTELDLVLVDGTPVLAVAVLAMASLSLFRLPQSVRECLAVSAGRHHVELWRRGDGAEWIGVADPRVLGPLALPLDTDELYAGVELDP